MTRELALPLIDETAGSEQLEAPGMQHGEEDDAAAPQPVRNLRPPLEEVQRTHQEELSKPHLNWTDPETGGLNEVAAGRVVVFPPSAHGTSE